MKFFSLRWLFILSFSLGSLYFLFRVKGILPPFIGGLLLAYLLQPSVHLLEKKGLKRTGSVTVIFIWISFFLSLIIFFLLPKLYLELGKLALVLPDRFQVIYEYVENLRTYLVQNGLPAEVNKLIDERLFEAQGLIVSWLEALLSQLPDIISSIGLMILSPILAIYFLLDWRRIDEGIVRLVPARWSGRWRKILLEMNDVVQGYVKGNILDAIIVGALIGLGVKLINGEYAFLIGVICGITNIVPYFGPFLGGIPAVLLALSKSPEIALKVALIILVVQQIDGNIINPKLMSSKVGFHPLGVVFALLAGAELAGIAGMLVAVPLAAILRIIFREIYFYLVSPRNIKPG